MNKFIEITENDKRILINLGYVIKIENHSKQCILHFIDGTPPLTITLAYESLKSILQDPNHSIYGQFA
jgi:hypothetical protein